MSVEEEDTDVFYICGELHLGSAPRLAPPARCCLLNAELLFPAELALHNINQPLSAPFHSAGMELLIYPFSLNKHLETVF